VIRIKAIVVSCLVVALQVAASRHAMAGAAEEASALKTKADEAFDGRRFAEALDQYRAALDKNRDARLH